MTIWIFGKTKGSGPFSETNCPNVGVPSRRSEGIRAQRGGQGRRKAPFLGLVFVLIILVSHSYWGSSPQPIGQNIFYSFVEQILFKYVSVMLGVFRATAFLHQQENGLAVLSEA